MDLASAVLESIRQSQDLAPLEMHRRRQKVQNSLEQAIVAYESDPEHNRAEIAGHAHLKLAELAIHDRAIDRARREVDACLAVAREHDDLLKRAMDLSRYLDERLDLFEAAARAIDPYIDIQGRPTKAIDSPETRASVARALEQLEEHHAIAPHRWQTLFFIAKGRAALGDSNGALAAWKKAWQDHPTSAEIAREYSLVLLRMDRVADALEIARAITASVTSDATLWSNRGVVELLSGNLQQSRECLDASDRLDPNDPINAAVRRRLDEIADGRRQQPRTLRELERGR